MGSSPCSRRSSARCWPTRPASRSTCKIPRPSPRAAPAPDDGSRGAPRLRRGVPNVGGCGGPCRGPPRRLMYFDRRLWALTAGVRSRIAAAVVIGLLAAVAGIARLALLGWLLARVLAGGPPAPPAPPPPPPPLPPRGPSPPAYAPPMARAPPAR